MVIGQIVENGIKTHVPPLIKAELKLGIDEIVNGVGQVLDESVLPLLGSIDKRLTKVEAEMVTKDYLDEKLGGYVQRPRLAF